jgi:hypothetical protein
MKLTVKSFFLMLVALLLAVLGGWIWGAADRLHATDALSRSGAGLHLANGRAYLLQARVDLFEVNFGDASRDLEAARAELKTAEKALDEQGRKAEAESVGKALIRIDDGQQLAGRLDQSANARLAEAVDLLPKAP